MYTGLKHLHSYTAYITLALLVIALIYALYGYFSKQSFTKTSKITALTALYGAHIQFIFGLVLYFVSPMGFSNFSSKAMSHELSRLYILEHPFVMIIGIVLITVGYARSKRLKSDQRKFRSISVFYFLGLLAILSRIPWQAWI